MRLTSNKQLVDYLIQSEVLKTPIIIEAFRKIDRKDFVPKKTHEFAYYDHPLHIGSDQTISQPFTVAFMLELLQPIRDAEILDIGSGSGWTTALLGQIVGKNGLVIGKEIKKSLVKIGINNLKNYNFAHCRIEQAEQSVLGEPGKIFDRILVSAAAEQFPEQILEQLKCPGKIVIPIKDSIHLISKDRKCKLNEEIFYGFSFVPLIS
jgi:protein-L-isoaspartate(D-aspartate) O-methyltransferase